MDIETYMREARRFDNHRPETMLDALAHGLMAEVGEVAECVGRGTPGEGLLLELGDVKWNLIRLVDVVGYDPFRLLINGWPEPRSVVYALANLVLHTGRIAGVLEKAHRIGWPAENIAADVSQHLHSSWQALSVLGHWFGYSPALVSEVNIKKLTERYAAMEGS